METYSPKKLEMFLWLALRQTTQLTSVGEKAEENTASENIFAALKAQLPAPEAEKFARLKADYQTKSEEKKANWQKQIKNSIGANNPIIDENIHWSHIDAALKKEIPAIRKIIVAALPPAHRKYLAPKEDEATEESPFRSPALAKSICQTFARQFVALSDLSITRAFDRLSGEQFARLVRMAGIREVAFACARITAVESVAAFVRRFPAEDARAIAAQLSDLPKASDERLLFAENIVQAALEIEPQPAAMLDLLGIWLVGILLSGKKAKRSTYTTQKLPLEFAPKLAEIIETQRQQTPPELQNEISAEIEQLARSIRQNAVKADSEFRESPEK